MKVIMMRCYNFAINFMNQPGEITKYDFIDSLRAVAILLVIFMHTNVFYPSSILFIRTIAERGGHGVQLFYLLSAFTLFLSLGERSLKSANTDKRDFYIRRFFRIAPLFYPALVVYAIYYYVDIHNVIHTGIQRWQWSWTPSGIKWWHFILSVLFLNGWMPETLNTIIPVGWSVAVEMTFYLSVPFLFKYIKNTRLAMVFVICSLILQNVLIAVIRPVVISAYPGPGRVVTFFFDNWFFSQLPIFGLGILTYHIFQKTRQLGGSELGIILICVFAAFFFDLIKVNEVNGAFLPELFYYGLIFMFLVLGVYFAPLKILVSPITAWVGRVSFSLYLVHFIALDFMLQIMPDGLPGVGKTVNFFLCYLIAVGLSCTISYFTYRFIELPGMQMGRNLIYRLNQTPQN